MNFWEARAAALEGKKIKIVSLEGVYTKLNFTNEYGQVLWNNHSIESEWEIVEEANTTSWFFYVDNIDFIGPYEHPSYSKLGKDGKGNWIEVITDENGKLISARNV
jgi:hypothetical protein